MSPDEQPPDPTAHEQAPAGERAGAQPLLPPGTEPDEVRQALETAQGIVPEPLQPTVIPGGEPPSIFIDAADGITTYAGFNGDARSQKARNWTIARLKAQRARYSNP
jgi:hypothetical protein